MPAHPAPPARVVVVHGYRASPADHWFPWLVDELTGEGVSVTVPELPGPDRPERSAWEEAAAAALGRPDERMWVVAHSLGCLTTLRVLAQLPGEWQLGGLVVVAGFSGRLPALPALDEYAAEDVDVDRVRGRIRTRLAVRSDADPYVPPTATDALAARLGAEITVVPGAGHFLAEDGVVVLPVVRDLVLTSS